MSRKQIFNFDFMYDYCYYSYMDTINISLPPQLKTQANQLIDMGFYASFSDLVRTALRQTINQSQYDIWADIAKKEAKLGKIKPLKTKKDIDNFLKNF